SPSSTTNKKYTAFGTPVPVSLRLRLKRPVTRPLDRTRSGIVHLWVIGPTVDDLNREGVLHPNLARKPRRLLPVLPPTEALLLPPRHRRRLTRQHRNAAGGAAGITAAPVQDVDAGILDTADETTPLLDFDRALAR